MPFDLRKRCSVVRFGPPCFAGSRGLFADRRVCHFDEHGVTHLGIIEVEGGLVLHFKRPEQIAPALFVGEVV